MDYKNLHDYLRYILKTISGSDGDLYAVARLDRELVNLKEHLTKDHEVDYTMKNEILSLKLDYQKIKVTLEEDRKRHMLYDFLEDLLGFIPFFKISRLFTRSRRDKKETAIIQPELVRLQKEVKDIIDKVTALHEV